MDLSNFGSQMGRALAGIVSGDNYRNAYDASMAKLAQADAMGASAALNRTKADEITNRMQYQRPEFSSKIAAGFAGLNDNQLGQVEAYQRGEIPTPEFFTPDVQRAYNYGVGVHRAGLGATGDSNADQMGKLFEALTRTGNVQRVIADPTTAAAVGKAYAATEGKPLINNLGNAGVFDQFSGGQTLNGIGTATIDREKAAAIENRAQAANAYASAALSKEKINTEKADADLKRSKIGQEHVMIMPDGSQIVTGGKIDKPMPAAALKMQNEELDAIGTAAGIEKDIGAFKGMIESGKLKLGPIENVTSAGKNMAGMSDENSRNFASFRATLEKMRNDSLRLNKGVQTEGDAQRAWNELLANLNDTNLVTQRLGEIARINQRAIQIRKNNVNTIRRNYGNSPMDFSAYTNIDAAVGDGQNPVGVPKPPEPPKQPVSTPTAQPKPQYTRQGTLNGRRVGVLSDGRTVYQDTGEEVK